MELTKEKLLAILSENYIADLGEMGRITDKQDQYAKSRPIFDKNKEKQIGWTMRSKLDDKNSKMYNVIYSCNVDEFKQNHPEEYEALKEKFGELYFRTDNCPSARPHKNSKVITYDERGNDVSNEIDRERYEPKKTFTVKVDGEDYQTFDTEAEAEEYASLMGRNGDVEVVRSDGKKSLQDTLKRMFNPIVNGLLNYDTPDGLEFSKELNKRSIPIIITNNTKYQNRYVEKWTNEKIEFEVLGFNLYPTAQSFLDSVVQRATGRAGDEVLSTTALARQFNQVYSNWAEDKKNREEYRGKTGDDDYVPNYSRKNNYNLNVSGYESDKLDVALKMKFSIKGEKIGDSFIWSISMINKFGRKRPEETSIAGGLKPMEIAPNGILDSKVMSVNTSVHLDPNEAFNDEHVILQNSDVAQGLVDTINNFKRLITSLKPTALLKFASFGQADVVRENKEINEIVKSALSGLKVRRKK